MPQRAPSHRPAHKRFACSPVDRKPKRASAHRRGYGRSWQKASLVYISEHPLCEPCLAQGIVEAAEVVDHKVPHRGDQRLFWDQTNWQSMSKRCHDRKTAAEDGGFGNRPGRATRGHTLR